MEQLTDLKAILHSKRANIYYLEKCRVLMKDGRVLYLTEEKEEKQYWNIPIANTTVILLGTGTSITQSAVRMLASAGVLIGFSGSYGTPLIAGNEVEWFSPQSEYRPTEYIQGWLSFWFDEAKRLKVAKQFQKLRMKFIQECWVKNRNFRDAGFGNAEIFQSLLLQHETQMESADSTMELLQIEALMTKKIYKFAAQLTNIDEFVRDHDGYDHANTFLNHGNYLAYGLAASTLWVLGIPHGFAVMHGKTRRGALVFDVADLVKDALVLPTAFLCAREKAAEQEFRQDCIRVFIEHQALDHMFDAVKDVALGAANL